MAVQSWICSHVPVHEKSRDMKNQQCGCASREDSDQPRDQLSLIRVFAVRMQKDCALILMDPSLLHMIVPAQTSQMKK